MSRHWCHERWRKLYLRESLDQQAWAWQVRGLRDLCIRIADDDGHLATSVDNLLTALRGGEELREAIDVLLDDGFLVEEDDCLVVRNLPVAQENPRVPRLELVAETGSEAEPKENSDASEEYKSAPTETKQERRRRLARDRAQKSRNRKKGVTESAPQSARDSAPERTEVRTQTVTESVTEHDEPRAVSGQVDLTDKVSKPDLLDIQSSCDSARERTGVRTQRRDESSRSSVTHIRNLEEALAHPTKEAAQYLVANPHMKDWLQPHKWPDVQLLMERLCGAMGWHKPRWNKPDGDTMRMVEALAEFSTEELDRAIDAAPRDKFLREKAKGLSAITPVVIRQLLAGPKAARGERRRGPLPVQPSHGTTQSLRDRLGVKNLAEEEQDDV